MQLSEAYHYLNQSERRRKILLALKQPMTARQLTSLTGLSLDACSRVLCELATHRLVQCVNPSARQSRLYWLAELGVRAQVRLRRASGLAPPAHDFPVVDWPLFGWVCYRHRGAVLKTFTEPMQPAAIKRKARSQNPQLRISANNVRDVIRLFQDKGIVRPIRVPRKAHLRYEPTEVGQSFRQLLMQAEVPE